MVSGVMKKAVAAVLAVAAPFVRTADNLADFFTKPLAHKKFLALRDRIMNHSSN